MTTPTKTHIPNARLDAILEHFGPHTRLVYLADGGEHLGDTTQDERVVNMPSYLTWSEVAEFATALRVEALRLNRPVVLIGLDRPKPVDSELDLHYIHVARLADVVASLTSPTSGQATKWRHSPYMGEKLHTFAL